MRDSHDNQTMDLNVGDAPRKRGRPAQGSRAMTPAERKARSRYAIKKAALEADIEDLSALTDAQLLYLMANTCGIAIRARIAWAEYGRRHDMLPDDPLPAVSKHINDLMRVARRAGESFGETVTKTEDAPAGVAVTKNDVPASAAKIATVTKNTRATAAYINPNDSTQTWSGRGRQPQWVVDYLAQGGRLDDCTRRAAARRLLERLGS
ncbi:H-NS family nucleoid-associated regulatory protein [Chitiniphilus eburneus]|uniref:H-NS histone family protein n=1 Tax=Chitiniphilus eburneus TaxID=2571148 RepID=UPI0035CFFAF8